MGWGDFLIILGLCSVAMVVCRVLPIFVLKGRNLPENVVRALGLIPPAAFAALVTNDLFKPDAFSAGAWPVAMPLIAAAITFVVGYKTKSLVGASSPVWARTPS